MAIGALQRAGLDVVAHDARAVLNHYPRGGLSLPGDGGGVWIVQLNAPECDALLQAIRHDAWRDRYRIGYWVWETTLAPADWVEVADWFHEIWTISRFSADALVARFRLAGRDDLAARVSVMPCPAPRLTGRRRRAAFGLSEDARVALSLFDGRSTFARKNPLGVVAAWVAAFPESSAAAQLAIKSIAMAADPAGADQLRAAASGRADIVIVDQVLSDADMADLVATADVVVSLHRSEGFGLLLAEAMVLGKVIISSDYAAPAEWLDPQNAILVAVDETPVVDPSGAYSDGNWCEPRHDSAVQALAQAFRSEEDLARLGGKARVDSADFDVNWALSQLQRSAFWAFVSTRLGDDGRDSPS